MAERYIPLSEVNTKRIKTTLVLPYHMEEEVGLNVKRMEFLCQLGGIGSLSIKNNNDRPVPTVVGLTDQGTAVAGFSATDSTVKYQNTNKSKEILYGARWSELDVSINGSEIRIKLDIEKKDPKDPNNWSKVIDRSLKDSVASASFQNLIKRKTQNMGFGILSNMIPTTYITHHILEKDLSRAAFVLFYWQMVAKFFSISRYGYEKPGEGVRWSLSMYDFPELDRKFVLDSIVLFSKLTRKIDK